ncbi:hypothetical protein CSOJ01_13244 [Colletotrichum sojae]|uniref:Secreted protein n=1 Tax=Colletotrichum sojae TaxID=2175907 RepID=A0A8H6MKK3_9PEZI|nr:hypothetical protein CSOJ01_13244 [Colletotrichum sojae]
MQTKLSIVLAALQIIPAVSAGFHLFDRHIQWNFNECVDCPKKQDCCFKNFSARDDVVLVPSNQFNCNTIRNKVRSQFLVMFRLHCEPTLILTAKNYMEGISYTSNIGHGTVIKGQCGSKSITLYPVNNGKELEVWESGGSKMYGKCYRQDAGKTMTCDDDGGVSCRGFEGEPIGGTCKIKATDVWVCPVSLC